MAVTDRVLLGVITTAHGIQGDVVVRAFTGDPMDIGRYGALTDADGGRPIEVVPRRMTPKGLIAKVAGVADRNAAEALRGAELWIARDQLPAADDDEFYYVDLIGLDAVDQAGQVFGRIQNVDNYGAGDLLDVVVLATGKSELVPFQKEYVTAVDLDARQVRIVWPIQYEIAQETGSDD